MLKFVGLTFVTIFSLLLSVSAQAKSTIPNHAVILLYHHVDNKSPDITSISPDMFSQQLAYLADNHFQVWPLEKIVNALQIKKPLPDKVVAITFDDSYQSVYENAYPLIKKYGWPFTIFVSTNAIDQGYNHQTSWQQLQIMASNGASIGNHSATHTHLLKRSNSETLPQWQQRITSDIERAEQRIVEKIGYSRKMFAYPYGEYNRDLTELVDQLGYTGFGQHSGAVGELSGFLTIPRFPFSGRFTRLEDFALKLMTLPFPIKEVVAADAPLDHRHSKPTLTLKWESPPPAFASLQCFGSNQGKLTVTLSTHNQAVITPNEDIPVGRSRYNCTASMTDNDNSERFYWYSQPWIRLDVNNQLILD
ncbi:MAG: polysaccharide deacetylase family protein [Oceanicoccus sp.]